MLSTKRMSFFLIQANINYMYGSPTSLNNATIWRFLHFGQLLRLSSCARMFCRRFAIRALWSGGSARADRHSCSARLLSFIRFFIAMSFSNDKCASFTDKYFCSSEFCWRILTSRNRLSLRSCVALSVSLGFCMVVVIITAHWRLLQ